MSNQYERPVVVEPKREVVEIDDQSGTVYFGEPIPTYAGSQRIDTTGAQTGQVLITDRDGVLRPANPRGYVTWWVDSVDDIPSEAMPGDVVALTDGSGNIFEVVDG